MTANKIGNHPVPDDTIEVAYRWTISLICAMLAIEPDLRDTHNEATILYKRLRHCFNCIHITDNDPRLD
jgi:hypothetical protein